MSTKNVFRLVAACVVSFTAFVFLGSAGLWGVALAAPCLVFAPSAIRGAVVERRDKRALDVAVAKILAGSRERG